MSIGISGTIQTLPKTWEQLNSRQPLRPIRNESQYKQVMKTVDRLAVLNHRTKDQSDCLDTLVALVEAYEREHHAIDTSDLGPLEMLRFLMEQHGWNGSDLGRFLGVRTMGPAIARGDRQLSKANMMKLSEHFGVSPSVFLNQPWPGKLTKSKRNPKSKS